MPLKELLRLLNQAKRTHGDSIQVFASDPDYGTQAVVESAYVSGTRGSLTLVLASGMKEQPEPTVQLEGKPPSVDELGAMVADVAAKLAARKAGEGAE